MRTVFLILVLLCCTANASIAQDTTLPVRITELDVSQFPTVQLKLQIRKALTSNITVSKNNAFLSENSIPQIVDFLECPQDDNTRLSLAILLDRSGSMRKDRFNNDDPDSTKIIAAKKAISTFLDLLGPRDEAGIFSFTTSGVFATHIFSVDHDFSFDVSSLKGSLVPLVADGGTRLWEAIIDAVDLLRVRPGKKALIVVTDGRNRFGNNLRSTAFQNAVDAGIPVYPIGLGDDIDVGALSSLASSTAGRFYPAPDAADLEDIFNQIGAELITDDCVLRYTSSNSCLDGSRRDIDLTLSGLGFLGEVDTFYVLPRKLNPVTLIVESGVDVVSRDSAVVPLTVLEQFSTTQPLTYLLKTRYDNTIMKFLGVQTLGTMSEGQSITVTENPPGVIQLQLINFLPAYASGALCELVFDTYSRETDTVTAVEIMDASIVGICPMEMTVRSDSVSVRACEETYTLGTSTLVVASDGEIIAVPVRINPRPSDEMPFDMDFSVKIDLPALEYLDVQTEGTLSSFGDVIVQENGVFLNISLRQVQSSVTDTVIILRFTARASTEVQKYPLELDLQNLQNGCLLRSQVEFPVIMIDGICQPLVRRKADSQSLQNHPNPFSGTTTLEYTVVKDGYVELFVLDGSGRRVRTLLASWLTAGTYAHTADMQDLPAGEYMAVIHTGENAVVRRLLLLK